MHLPGFSVLWVWRGGEGSPTPKGSLLSYLPESHTPVVLYVIPGLTVKRTTPLTDGVRNRSRALPHHTLSGGGAPIRTPEPEETVTLPWRTDTLSRPVVGPRSFPTSIFPAGGTELETPETDGSVSPFRVPWEPLRVPVGPLLSRGVRKTKSHSGHTGWSLGECTFPDFYCVPWGRGRRCFDR